MTALQQEFRTMLKDNSSSWLLCDSKPKQERDGAVLWHGVITDISYRKEAERIKNEFVATISHEIRTLLTSIYGSLRLLNSGVLEQRHETTKKMMKNAESNFENLLYLINDLLDIEKLDKSSLELYISEIDLNPSFSPVLKKINHMLNNATPF